MHAQPAAAVRNDLPQPYRTTRDWGQLPAGMTWPAVTAVEPAPDGTIYVVERCFENSCAGRSEPPILRYSKDGKLLASFGQNIFVFPHGATVDGNGNLWVTDARGRDGKGHQVFKFSPEGKVLMTLGKAGVSGSGSDLFDQPTDVVVAPNGDIFVTDSHRAESGRTSLNNRVVKFTRNGRFVKEWGKKGSGRGELSEPHTIAIDSRGRLFVGDRENNRIQIFDQNGTFIDEWRQFGRPSGISITRDDTIYVADSESGPDTGAHELTGIKKGIRIGSAGDGRVTAFIEDMESTRADHSGAEGVGVDADGNVYGAVVRRRMLERHIRKNDTPKEERHTEAVSHRADTVNPRRTLDSRVRCAYGLRVTFWTRQFVISPMSSSCSLRQSIELAMPNSFGSLPALPNLPRILPSSETL
jgi:sugar lactone lactonase YvrE